MYATICRTDAIGMPVSTDVVALRNVDLADTSVRGFTPIIRTPDGRLEFDTRQPEPLPGAFDSSDIDACIRLSKAGHMAAAMGKPLDPGMPEDYRRGYLNYRPDDGERFGADMEPVYQDVTGRMRADGLLPDRRRNIESQAHRVGAPAWEQAMWLVVVFVGGVAAPGVIDGLRRLVGSLL